jgi:hypothetical protein
VPRYFTHYWTNETWERRKRRWESDHQEGTLAVACRDLRLETYLV